MQSLLQILRYIPERCDDLLVSASRLLWRKFVTMRTRLAPTLGLVWRRSKRIARRACARVAGVLALLLSFAHRHLSAPSVVGILALAVTAVAAALWRGGNVVLLGYFCGLTKGQIAPLMQHLGMAMFCVMLLRLAAVVALFGGVASLLAFVRKPFAFWVVKAAAAGYALLSLLVVYTTWHVPSLLNSMDPELFDKYSRNEVWVTGTGRSLPLLLLGIFFLFVLVLRVVSESYGRAPTAGLALGDRIWSDLVSHGSDPTFRKALYRSAFAHLFVFLILPEMLGLQGCMKPYGVPLGSGSPVLEMVRIKKVKKKKIEKKLVFNMNSAISFYVPKIDDSEVFEEVEVETERLHEAESLGKLGQGGGKTGGWPNGMEKAKVRFIRLEYSGGDWDQDMGADGDYNMLLIFRELTGFNIWPRTEHIPVAKLSKFPRKRAPPFVYLTGGLQGSMFFTQSEIKALRHYCLKMGGLIFADNGGGNFDRNFRLLLRRVFPDLPIVTISHDDVIFRQPFVFPNGAPALWHHSGNDAMGVKYRGRWVVFYHQGDVNDAWKNGHSGASKGVARQAYKLGINVINYSFNQYMQINFGGTVGR